MHQREKLRRWASEEREKKELKSDINNGKKYILL